MGWSFFKARNNAGAIIIIIDGVQNPGADLDIVPLMIRRHDTDQQLAPKGWTDGPSSLDVEATGSGDKQLRIVIPQDVARYLRYGKRFEFHFSSLGIRHSMRWTGPRGLEPSKIDPASTEPPTDEKTNDEDLSDHRESPTQPPATPNNTAAPPGSPQPFALSMKAKIAAGAVLLLLIGTATAYVTLGGKDESTGSDTTTPAPLSSAVSPPASTPEPPPTRDTEAPPKTPAVPSPAPERVDPRQPPGAQPANSEPDPDDVLRAMKKLFNQQ